MSNAMDTICGCQKWCRAALLLAIFISAFMVTTSPLRAENRAILVGVSEYQNASLAHPLQGPKNDVVLMHDVLRKRGFSEEQIQILADHVSDPVLAQAAVLPTRANIMSALEDVAEKAQPGDRVVIYLSGHGSRQPASKNGIGADLHQDNLDEIFLPIDIGPWEQEIGSVQNAIVDREIGAIIKRIRSRGGFVWLIVDACYSGHMDRAAVSEYVAVRGVDPTDLGIPPIDATGNSGSTPGQTPWLNPEKDGEHKGNGAVAFLAAGPDQKSAEALFPTNSSLFYTPSNQIPIRQVDGMLTFYLTQALARHPTATFMDIGQAVVAGYSAWARGDCSLLCDLKPYPVITGELERSVTGGEAAAKYWSAEPILAADENLPVTEIDILAGLLDGLTAGRKVAIRELATGEEVATAQVTQVFAVKSRAVLATPLKAEIAAAIRRPTGAQPILVVDPLGPVLNFNLAVALPGTSANDDHGARAVVAEAIRLYQLKNDFEKIVALDFVALDLAEPAPVSGPSQVAAANPIVVAEASSLWAGIALRHAKEKVPTADIYLKIWNGRLWLLTIPAEFRPEGITPYGHLKTPSLAIKNDPAALAQELEGMLHKVAEVRNLLAVASEIAGSPASHDLDAQLFVLRAPSAVAGKPLVENAAAPPYQICLPTPRDVIPPDAELITIGQPLTVGHCDTIYLKISNSGTSPIDLTILDVTADNGIFTPSDAFPLRVQAKEKPVVIAYQLAAWDTHSNKPFAVGPERLILLGVQRQADEDLGIVLNYASRFIQDGFEGRTRSVNKAAQSNSVAGLSLDDLLDRAAFGGVTRGNAAQNVASLEEAFAIVISWDMRALP